MRRTAVRLLPVIALALALAVGCGDTTVYVGSSGLPPEGEHDGGLIVIVNGPGHDVFEQSESD